MILFDYEYSLQKNSYNLAYAHIFPGTPNSEFVKKDGYQVPYKFYVFADMSYPYMFKNDGEYSLSLLTKIAGDEKYGDNPLIANFDLDTEGNISKTSYASSVVLYIIGALAIIIGIIFIYRKRLKLIINKK